MALYEAAAILRYIDECFDGAPILAYVEDRPEGAKLMANAPNVRRAQSVLRARASFTEAQS